MITVNPINRGLRGSITVPADKSISHRAAIFSAIADKPVEIFNFLRAEDCLSTLNCLHALGTDIQIDNDKVLVAGKPFRQPSQPLDAGNSGTTARLLTGLLAAQNFATQIIGDSSLSKRPMRRIITPLKKMGANISARNDNFLPINIQSSHLRGIEYTLPIASAQLKSAILLAGLFAEGTTTIIEPIPSRNHSELMLAAFNANINKTGNRISIAPSQLIAPTSITVPNDFSSAAFFIVLATILPNSSLTIKNVGINSTRAGLLEILNKMGANITVLNERHDAEPVADLLIQSANLKSIEFGGDIIPRLIDEVPVLAVAAAFAEGTTIIHDLAELRVKESDRLATIAEQFNKIAPGAFSVVEDSLIIRGQCPMQFAPCDSLGDHRIAMALAVFAAAAHGADIDNERCVDISFPDFFIYFMGCW